METTRLNTYPVFFYTQTIWNNWNHLYIVQIVIQAPVNSAQVEVWFLYRLLNLRDNYGNFRCLPLCSKEYNWSLYSRDKHIFVMGITGIMGPSNSNSTVTTGLVGVWTRTLNWPNSSAGFFLHVTAL